LHVVAGARIPAQTAEHDAEEGGVGLPVAAAVESVAGPRAPPDRGRQIRLRTRSQSVAGSDPRREVLINIISVSR
jgi:hypothetical protein